ncbi:UDP-N-acetylmuramoyl-L-alanyl-D-glutamate--2,6-diaminopimelate ligase [Corynebacterium occultum]|uniref:UDP-N-acetylmuramoyl-L-alanyl-D-glutamate--2,6-diaminopimelate ligase n=1 Tax=Corynebacterium occultum TaxID=2675219 RepID=A0A6B8W5H1_9CORY|nr:UDP-N-acetylmuramoyl-L-alanyl-D-glutamate--2,6-diaminopimelate ligase [Corynebacterium occultum]QGU07811.1 UDP-N-acetylmuramoyl-L-alanyl-D-glutamate--2,6-diaminopimelate ligase [Corynebacterium occultum]
MATTLAELFELLPAASSRLLNCDDPTAVQITEIGLDSSVLPQGAIFAAVPGTRTHGASFAMTTGAAAILTDAAGLEILQTAGEDRPVLVVEDVREVLGRVSAEVYGNPSRELILIGVTGTSGKTTTSYLMEAGLMAAGHEVGLIGTTGTRIAGKKVRTKLTTPEAPTLQALFRRMVEAGVSHVVMEVSSHALSLGRVSGSDFDVAAFTNLSQDHLDFHPTMEDYFEAKALFFRADSPVAAHRTVICVDDQWGERMAQLAVAPLTVATRGRPADISAAAPEIAPSGAQNFQATLPSGKEIQVSLPLPGEFNVANATLALGAAIAAGVDAEDFIRGLRNVAVPGRMERIDEGQDFIAVVDYAHKPAAVAAVLDTLRGQVKGRVGVVVGAGGNRDSSKRPIMGAESARRADLVIITDDNPRDEEPAPIRAAVVSGAQEAAGEVADPPEIREIADRARAIDELISWARPGDAVIVAGKGHEVGQLIKGVNHHFDDREEVRRALGEILGDRNTSDTKEQA